MNEFLILDFDFVCRKNGVPGTESRPQKHQSHLMDLLDISLGATSISSPPQNSDPWGMPVAETNKVIVFKQKKIVNQTEFQMFVFILRNTDIGSMAFFTSK